MKPKNITLGVFLASHDGLKSWRDYGLLDREIEIYKRLSLSLKEVNLVSYGGREDFKIISSVKPVKVLTSRWLPSSVLTVFYLLMKNYPSLKKIDVVKTNQIAGAEIAIRLKRLLGKKLIVRAGYLPSRFLKKETVNSSETAYASLLERQAFSVADIGVVTTQRDRQYLIRRYGLDPDKIRVIPNYVLTDAFKPNPPAKKKYDLIFVGRSGKQKNLHRLLKAILLLKKDGKNISLLLIGRCCQDRLLRNFVQVHDLMVTFQGSVPHLKLPGFLNQARIFILPSLWEGHPKALLEAMSCGLPCIGNKTSSVSQEIRHLQTGYLTKASPKKLACAINYFLNKPKLRLMVGQNARDHILKNYSIERILKLELDIIREVIEK